MKKVVSKKCEKCRYLEEKNKGNCPSHKGKKNAGRKQFDGKSEKLVLAKLEQAFSQGSSDKEACNYAQISVDALYDYQTKKPQFLQQKELWRKKPSLLARTNVVSVMGETREDGKPTDRSLDSSWKYLERKERAEFAPHSTAIVDDGKGVLTEERKKEIATALANWEGRFTPKK